MNHNGVYRTAPATPGLLAISGAQRALAKTQPDILMQGYINYHKTANLSLPHSSLLKALYRLKVNSQLGIFFLKYYI